MIRAYGPPYDFFGEAPGKKGLTIRVEISLKVSETEEEGDASRR